MAKSREEYIIIKHDGDLLTSSYMCMIPRILHYNYITIIICRKISGNNERNTSMYFLIKIKILYKKIIILGYVRYKYIYIYIYYLHSFKLNLLYPGIFNFCNASLQILRFPRNFCIYRFANFALFNFSIQTTLLDKT